MSSQQRETRRVRFVGIDATGQPYTVSGNAKYLVITDPPERIFDVADLGLNDGRRVERIKQGEYRVQGSDLILRSDDPGAP
jgi:hypothetical protein